MPFPLIFALISTLAGTTASYLGQRNAAKAADQTAQYNAKLQRDQALREGEAAAENARRKARENARVIGHQRALIAQSGLAMEGTPLAVLGETAMTLQRDILDMGYEAKNRANALHAQANMGVWEGRTRASAMRTEAAATGLSGLGNMAMGYLNATGKIAPPKTV